MVFDDLTFGRTYVDLSPGGPSPTILPLGNAFISPLTGIGENVVNYSGLAGIQIGLFDGFLNAATMAPSYLSFTTVNELSFP
ncbi:MAG: hypothetical protein ACI8TQ_001108 [Planctomycetota bacterium]